MKKRVSEPFISPRLLSEFGTQGGAVRFSFEQENGEVVRCQVRAEHFTWLAAVGACLLFPRAERLLVPLIRWAGRRRQARIHSLMSSGMPSVEGSPKEGQPQ